MKINIFEYLEDYQNYESSLDTKLEIVNIDMLIFRVTAVSNS